MYTYIVYVDVYLYVYGDPRHLTGNGVGTYTGDIKLTCGILLPVIVLGKMVDQREVASSKNGIQGVRGDLPWTFNPTRMDSQVGTLCSAGFFTGKEVIRGFRSIASSSETILSLRWNAITKEYLGL